jgi:hypothetical protein
MRTAIAVLASAAWVSFHEFLRNQALLIDHWTGHYEALGLAFPDTPLNGALWGAWGLCFSIALLLLSTRFSLVEAAALGWFCGFVLMWIVVGNLGALPFGVLPYAVPWSLVEVFGAVWLIRRIRPIAA